MKNKYPTDKIQCSSCLRFTALNDNIRLNKLIHANKTLFTNGGNGSHTKLRKTYKCRRCMPKKGKRKTIIPSYIMKCEDCGTRCKYENESGLCNECMGVGNDTKS